MALFFRVQDNFLKELMNSSILIECRKGLTCNGKLMKFDAQLNIFMENSILTNKVGTSFRETKELFLKGKMVKYLRML
jgi:small nuclear ribonucleoprotein (snRNP)-like protein